ncbi:uncharacterized protein N7529_001907 [Penicillium soppii]|uniref:uncharacterized protein n=1 Tax=Penicillium soppii TaxID=69789 RepID=UPI002547FE08|nr:uncharacterized protein N7529_001907 [Penicillium soppii]KAJ5876323.1 hypothetical protein N7529_001907 [Penicillium soppii]
MASRRKQPRNKDGIHFVNARPSTETEKLKAQRMVRAHVGRWISDQTKDRSKFHRAIPSSSSTSQQQPSHPLLARVRPIPGPTRAPDRTSPFPPSNAFDSSDSSSDESNSDTRIRDPRVLDRWYKLPALARLERNVSSMFDPFVTYPAPRAFEPEMIDMSERYITGVVWPGLTPRPDHIKTPGNKSWFQMSMANPELFTAFMFGSLCHLRVQWQNNWIPGTTFGPRQRRALQICEMEAIKLINQAVRNPNPKRAVSDAVLLAVICMAHHQAEEGLVHQHRKTPFNPPFPRLQWIDVYGCLPPNMVHIKGLVQLIKLRGGLTNIPTEGLAATISFSDILTCSVFCVHPCFEFWPLTESRMGMSIQEMLGFTQRDIDQGFGRLQEIGATSQMAEAFQAVHAYISMIKANPTSVRDHTLLSLAPAADLHTFFSLSHAATYEACRLAALIFGVGVLFPIPAQNTPLNNIARLIQAVLLQPTASELWSTPATRIPLLWILTLGGIAASETPERAWFVSALEDIMSKMGIHTWPSLKTLLVSMIWYDAACDMAAEALWFECQSQARHGYVIES